MSGPDMTQEEYEEMINSGYGTKVTEKSKVLSHESIANLDAIRNTELPNIWVPHFHGFKIKPYKKFYDINYLIDCIEDVYKWNINRYSNQKPDPGLTLSLLVEEGFELREACKKIEHKISDKFTLKEVEEVLDAYGDLTFVYYGFISRMCNPKKELLHKNTASAAYKLCFIDEQQERFYKKERSIFLPLIRDAYNLFMYEFINSKYLDITYLAQFCLSYHTEILCAVCKSNNTKQIVKAKSVDKANGGKGGKGPNFKEPDFKHVSKHWKSFENLIGRY